MPKYEVLHPGNPGHEAAIQVVDMVHEIGRMENYRSTWEVFNDFLEIMQSAMVGDNETYMRTIARYKKESLELVAQAGAALDWNFMTGFHDVLGLAYMELDLKNERTGQYFTPWEIAELMAAMIVGEKGQNGGNKRIMFCEPCIGSGTMALAAMQEAWKVGPEFFWRWQWFGQDIDRRCVLMASIQMKKALWNHSPFGIEINRGILEGRIPPGVGVVVSCLLRGVEPHGIPVPEEVRRFASAVRTMGAIGALLFQEGEYPEPKVLLSADEKKAADFQAEPTPAKFNDKGQGELF